MMLSAILLFMLVSRGSVADDGLFCQALKNDFLFLKNDKIYTGLKHVYFTQNDPPALVLRLVDMIPTGSRQPSLYMTVIGSESGLYGLLLLEPQDAIVFYDMNPWMMEYGKMFVELIKSSLTREEFLSAFYGRHVGPFLISDSNDLSLAENDPDKYDPRSAQLDQDVIAKTRAKLPESVRCAYDYLLEKCSTGNCQQLRLYHPPGEFGNSFFYGHGYLQDEQSYKKLRRALTANNLLYIESAMGDVLATLESNFSIQVHGRSVVNYASNINSWCELLKENEDYTSDWPTMLQKMKEVGPNLYTITTGWGPGDTMLEHRPAFCPTDDIDAAKQDEINDAKWLAVSHALQGIGPSGSRVLEVKVWTPLAARGGLWREAEVSDYLTGNFTGIRTVIAHMIVGNGVDKGVWRQVLMKARDTAENTLVLEPNGTGGFTFEELEMELRQLEIKNFSGCFVADLANLFFIARTNEHNQSVHEYAPTLSKMFEPLIILLAMAVLIATVFLVRYHRNKSKASSAELLADRNATELWNMAN